MGQNGSKKGKQKGSKRQTGVDVAELERQYVAEMRREASEMIEKEHQHQRHKGAEGEVTEGHIRRLSIDREGEPRHLKIPTSLTTQAPTSKTRSTRERFGPNSQEKRYSLPPTSADIFEMKFAAEARKAAQEQEEKEKQQATLQLQPQQKPITQSNSSPSLVSQPTTITTRNSSSNLKQSALPPPISPLSVSSDSLSSSENQAATSPPPPPPPPSANKKEHHSHTRRITLATAAGISPLRPGEGKRHSLEQPISASPVPLAIGAPLRESKSNPKMLTVQQQQRLQTTESPSRHSRHNSKSQSPSPSSSPPSNQARKHHHSHKSSTSSSNKDKGSNGNLSAIITAPELPRQLAEEENSILRSSAPNSTSTSTTATMSISMSVPEPKHHLRTPRSQSRGRSNTDGTDSTNSSSSSSSSAPISANNTPSEEPRHRRHHSNSSSGSESKEEKKKKHSKKQSKTSETSTSIIPLVVTPLDLSKLPSQQAQNPDDELPSVSGDSERQLTVRDFKNYIAGVLPDALGPATIICEIVDTPQGTVERELGDNETVAADINPERILVRNFSGNRISQQLQNPQIQQSQHPPPHPLPPPSISPSTVATVVAAAAAVAALPPNQHQNQTQSHNNTISPPPPLPPSPLVVSSPRINPNEEEEQQAKQQLPSSPLQIEQPSTNQPISITATANNNDDNNTSSNPEEVPNPNPVLAVNAQRDNPRKMLKRQPSRFVTPFGDTQPYRLKKEAEPSLALIQVCHIRKGNRSRWTLAIDPACTAADLCVAVIEMDSGFDSTNGNSNASNVANRNEIPATLYIVEQKDDSPCQTFDPKAGGNAKVVEMEEHVIERYNTTTAAMSTPKKRCSFVVLEESTGKAKRLSKTLNPSEIMSKKPIVVDRSDVSSSSELTSPTTIATLANQTCSVNSSSSSSNNNNNNNNNSSSSNNYQTCPITAATTTTTTPNILLSPNESDKICDESAYWIREDEITWISKISSGSFARVYKGMYRNKLVAVKMLKGKLDEKVITEFRKEFKILKAVRNENLVECIGVCFEHNRLSYVFEYMQRGTLVHLMMDPNVQFAWPNVTDFFEQATKGLRFLHEGGTSEILHRDLKSQNLLVTRDYRVKLGDFGLSRFNTVSNGTTLGNLCGTMSHAAPEVFTGEKFTAKSDIYSMGMILWELAYRTANGSYSTPFKEFPYIHMDIQIIIQASQKHLRPTIPAKTPDHIANLIRKCWDKDAKLRPSASEILEILKGYPRERMGITEPPESPKQHIQSPQSPSISPPTTPPKH